MLGVKEVKEVLLLKMGKRGKEKVHKRYETKVKDWEKTNLVTTTTTTGENHNHAILWYCGSTEIHVGVDWTF